MPEIAIIIVSILLLIAIVQIIMLKKKLSKLSAVGELRIKLKEAEEKIIKLKSGYNNIKEQNDFLKSKNRELERKMKELEEANLELLEKKETLQTSKEKLELLHKQKEELFAMAIHDIKNPVSAIKGYLDLLDSYDLTAQEQQEIMSGLMASSDRIVRLAQEIAETVVLKDNVPKLKLQVTSIKDIIDSVYRQNITYAERKNIKLVNKSSHDLPKVEMDPEKIEEAIDNLVNNGIKYGPERTTVQIKTFFNSEKITIEITDDGQGMSPEDMEQIFEKGKLLSTEPTGDETRSGLGLWIVKNIIDEHKGEIKVDSKLGVGTTFTIKLPYTNK
jgi:two-component system sensor histidine kinase/response regulator